MEGLRKTRRHFLENGNQLVLDQVREKDPVLALLGGRHLAQEVQQPLVMPGERQGGGKIPKGAARRNFAEPRHPLDDRSKRFEALAEAGIGRLVASLTVVARNLEEIRHNLAEGSCQVLDVFADQILHACFPWMGDEDGWYVTTAPPAVASDLG